ncbi:MAG: hypothetical protein DRP30_03990, partial [Thermotoga sp.]
VVEQVIGKIKNAYGQGESVKGLEVAKKEVWVKGIAYNWAQAIIFFCFCCWLYETFIFFLTLSPQGFFEHTHRWNIGGGL